MRKQYDVRVVIASALWSFAVVSMLIGVIWEWELWRDVALQATLAAACASLAATAHRSTRLIVHVIALYRGDLPVDSPHRRRAETMMSPDGDSPSSADGVGPHIRAD
jgi:hypothetical protein